MIGELLDKAIGVFAPAAALRRMGARQTLQMLGTYAAADQGRRNDDWRRAGSGSADLAIIPDARTLNARARALVRDSWVAQSAISSFSRNVVGRGITPVPVARDATGKELKDFNRLAEELFWRWASDKNLCDIEKRQTFWSKQTLCAEERVTVGEHFIVLSYEPNSFAPGLKFQSFEAEQLYDVIQDYQGNQVRGGIEIDEKSAPVAYHFYTRNPTDYLFRTNFYPVRLPAERVLHYFRQGRTRQTRGETSFHAVMQKIRDQDRYDQATLFRAVMEACIGGALKTSTPPPGPGMGVTFPLQSGDTGATVSGMKKIDFVPGMFPVLQPNEEIIFNTPQASGANYAPYTMQTLRAIAAGMNTSYEQIARDFSQGTYSSQRQGLLEDRRAWMPEQDLLIDLVIAPIYRAFISYAFIEGRFDGVVDMSDFLDSPARYMEAEFVSDGHDWIDPIKEVSAQEKAIALRIKTRKEIITASGGRLRRTFEQIADEKKLADELGITLPENVIPPQQQMKGTIDGGGAGGGNGSPAPAPTDDQPTGEIDDTDTGAPDFDAPAASGNDAAEIPSMAPPVVEGARSYGGPTDTFGPNDVFDNPAHNPEANGSY